MHVLLFRFCKYGFDNLHQTLLDTALPARISFLNRVAISVMDVSVLSTQRSWLRGFYGQSPVGPSTVFKLGMNGVQTVRVDLDKPIPVLIVYGTAIVLAIGDRRSALLR